MNVIIVDKKGSALWLVAKNREKTGLYKVFAAFDYVQPSSMLSDIVKLNPKTIIFAWRSCIGFIANDLNSMRLLRKLSNDTRIAVLIPDHLSTEQVCRKGHVDPLEFADYFLVTSNKLHDIYQKSPYSEKLGGVLHDIPDVQYIENIYRGKRDIRSEQTIIWVGNSRWGVNQGFKDHKGLASLMLPAFKFASKSFTNLQLSVIDSSKKRLDNHEVLEKIYSSNLLVQTSKSEGTGLPIVEASGLGVLVLTTNVGVAEELLKDELEFLICSFNPEDLALKIISAIPREKELNIQLRDAYNNYILIALQETLDPKKFIKNTGTWRRKNGKKFISLIWLIRFLRSKN
jgi:glycosyltransferase involved in cell wall biosynthesis